MESNRQTLDDICETYNSDDDDDVVIDVMDETDSDDEIDIDNTELDGILTDTDSDSMDEFIEYDEPDEHTKEEVRKIIEEISKPRLVMGPDGPMRAPDSQVIPTIPEHIQKADDDTYVLWILQNRMGQDMTLEKYAEYVSSKNDENNDDSNKKDKVDDKTNTSANDNDKNDKKIDNDDKTDTSLSFADVSIDNKNINEVEMTDTQKPRKKRRIN
jgi:hypothetical protein